MKSIWAKFLALVLVAGSAFAMVAVSFDAEARRFGGGFSSGRQSINVLKQKQATVPSAAAAARAPAAAGGARWLGPLAGIAAGLGLAALLSHFGFGGALADLLVIALIAGIALVAIRFIARTLQGGLSLSAESQGRASDKNSYRNTVHAREPGSGLAGLMGSGTPTIDPVPTTGDWFIPAGFDQDTFLDEAKKQFAAVQAAWDTGDYDQLRHRLTDEFYAEYAPKLTPRPQGTHTEIVSLSADLLGLEKLNNGYLASVRFSGSLREDGALQAAGFEEAWNLYKPEGQGWLLAGIQQLPTQQT